MPLTSSPFLTSIALVASQLACGGDYAPDPDTLESGQNEIIGGRRDSVHVAVGRVGWSAGGGDVDWICTGTLFGPRSVITAAHCLFGEDGRRVRAPRVVFSAAGAVHRVVQTRIAPRGDDAAVLILESEAEPAPIALSSDAPDIGAEAVVVGYGVTRATGPQRGTGAGTRRSARIHLDFVGEREIAYEVAGHGACYGDSGGPVLVDFGEGEVIGGITSRGSGTLCRGTDIAVRADVLARWAATCCD